MNIVVSLNCEGARNQVQTSVTPEQTVKYYLLVLVFVVVVVVVVVVSAAG